MIIFVMEFNFKKKKIKEINKLNNKIFGKNYLEN